MILKFAAVALLSSSSTITDAFVPSKRTTRALQLRSSLDRDWDNGDFLSSLSGSPNEIAEANAKYQTQSQNRAQMNEWRLRQMQQSSTQLNASSSDGGNCSAGGDFGPSPELLKKMGLSGEEDASQLRQQQQNQGPPPGMAPPQQQFQGQPQMQQPPSQAMMPPQMQQPPQQQQQFYDQNGNPVNMPMVYDQNGNLVPYYPPPQQQMMQQPLQQQQQVNPVPSFEPAPFEPPLPPTTKERESDGPRPVGYNADAYAISNTADVYFAQLKQDSRVRKRAWLAGDKETANQVFADESVTSIRDNWVDNPYTKEKNMQEARAEIEGAVRLQMGGDDVEESAKASSGISYKQKLEAIKAKRGGKVGAVGGGAAPPQSQPVVTKPPPPAQVNPPAPKMQQQPPPPPVQQKPVAPVQTIPSSPPPPPRAMAAPPKPSASEAATSAALPGALAEDEKRRELRTLQGLLLKQRGGPGFGSGRLREPEAQRLENTLGKVMDILRSEDGDFIAGTPAAASPPPVVQAPKPVQPAQPVKPAQPIMQPPPQPVQQMQSTPAPVVQSQVDPMTGSIACVEAALKMYQDASPAEREVMMIPLREALMAAASGANKAIAEAELNAHKAAIEAGPPQSMPSMQQEQPMMGFPTTYAVTKADTPVAAAAPPAADTVQRLTNAYDALTDAQGSGKLGLKNLSGNEASALANQVESMRGILLDELNN
jgi:hypothetical protein